MGIRAQLTLLVPGVVAIALSAVAALAVRASNRDALEEFKELNLTALEALSVTVATSVAQNEWAEARKQSDFTKFRPWLEKILELGRAQGLTPAALEDYI